MRLRLAILLFLAASFALFLWLFANSFAWSMAEFDCIDGYWACRKHLIGPTVLNVSLGFLIWALLAAPLVREWYKS
jgi:hypothetical protein